MHMTTYSLACRDRLSLLSTHASAAADAVNLARAVRDNKLTTNLLSLYLIRLSCILFVQNPLTALFSLPATIVDQSNFFCSPSRVSTNIYIYCVPSHFSFRLSASFRNFSCTNTIVIITENKLDVWLLNLRYFVRFLLYQKYRLSFRSHEPWLSQFTSSYLQFG